MAILRSLVGVATAVPLVFGSAPAPATSSAPSAEAELAAARDLALQEDRVHVVDASATQEDENRVLRVSPVTDSDASDAGVPDVSVFAGDAIDAQTAGDEIVIGIGSWDDESQLESSGGVVTATTDEAITTALPTSVGLQLVSVIADASAPTEFSYSLRLPSEAVVYRASSGALVVEDGSDEGIGKFEAPWAVDADGREVPTHFEYEGGALRQVVEHSASEYTYPIVADPAWSYTYTAAARQGNGALVTGSEVPWDVYTELKRCFNCSFPVSGAPKAYPKKGQLIKLNASPFTCINVPAPVRFYPLGSAGSGSPDWYFTAEAGHFDGEGSKISFDFYKPKGYPVRIAIAATVKKDNGSAANAANAYVAKNTWSQFINSLILNIRRN